MADVSNIFTSTIQLLATALGPMIKFYNQRTVAHSLPKEYNQYEKLRCIVDCSELFIQKPSDLKLQAATWSDYKHHNTIKFLIAVAPQGCIVFLSDLWGGRSSDRHIVLNSGFINHLNPGDTILADRGFPSVKINIKIDSGADLVNPPANKGKSQMTKDDIVKTKQIANVRIHVERVIRRLKHFRILTNIIPINLVPQMDNILKVCCCLTNMTGPIVKSWSECHVESDDD